MIRPLGVAESEAKRQAGSGSTDSPSVDRAPASPADSAITIASIAIGGILKLLTPEDRAIVLTAAVNNFNYLNGRGLTLPAIRRGR